MDQTEIEVAIEELEQRLERLRSLFEQYFLGIEKVEPSVAQKDVDRRIYVLRRVQVRNSIKRFRLQAIIQRYNTYQQHWVRICREIENGTYKRQLRRLDNKPGLTIASRRRQRSLPSDTKEIDEASEVTPTLPPKVAARTGEQGSAEIGSAPGASPARKLPQIPGPASTRALPAIPGAPKAAPQPGVEAAAERKVQAAAAPDRVAPADAVLPPRPSPPRVGAKPPPPPSAVKAGAGALSEQRIKELHAELAREKKKLAEPASVSLDGLTKRLRDAEAKLQQQHRGKNVDFRVVVEGGKAVVKPVLR